MGLLKSWKSVKQNPFTQKNWWKYAFFFGIWMFLFTTILFQLLIGEGINLNRVVFSFIGWMVSSFVFSYIMYRVSLRKQKKNEKDT